MKKNISWQVLIVIGLAGDLIGRFTDGVIGDGIGVIGDVCFLIGIANMIVAFVKNKKQKDISKKITFEIEKNIEKKKFDYRKYIRYAPYGAIIILVFMIIFLINKNNRPFVSSDEKSIIKQLPEQKGDGSFNFNAEENLGDFIVGFWLNEKINTSYFFEKDKTFSIVSGEDVSTCTYETGNQNLESNSIIVWFRCPMSDAPNYAEEHTINFSKDYKSFTDTRNVYANIEKIAGQFIKVETK